MKLFVLAELWADARTYRGLVGGSNLMDSELKNKNLFFFIGRVCVFKCLTHIVFHLCFHFGVLFCWFQLCVPNWSCVNGDSWCLTLVWLSFIWHRHLSKIIIQKAGRRWNVFGTFINQWIRNIMPSRLTSVWGACHFGLGLDYVCVQTKCPSTLFANWWKIPHFIHPHLMTFSFVLLTKYIW